MSELNKNQTLTLIKQSNINSSTVEYNQNHFTINIQGELMKKEEPTISLKSIYELMINKFESIENRLDNIEKDMTIIKKLPTIAKELNESI